MTARETTTAPQRNWRTWLRLVAGLLLALACVWGATRYAQAKVIAHEWAKTGDWLRYRSRQTAPSVESGGLLLP
ncbi:MAG: hypothetical protein ACTSXZ_01960, partial [Alphaproteobacteria bacterium]